MNRREAAEKVAKLRRLAHGTTSTEEAATARQAADKIVKEHGLSEGELDVGALASAYDDLLRSLEATVSSRSAEVGDAFGTAKLVEEVTSKLRGASPEEKASRLRTAATVIRTLAFVSGKEGLAASVKKCLEKVLKDHKVTI